MFFGGDPSSDRDQSRSGLLLKIGPVAELLRISPDWADATGCIVAAPGPSLTPGVALQCRVKRLTHEWKIIAVQDAYRLLPWADALYGCDNHWWEMHGDCGGFQNEKWSTHDGAKDSGHNKFATGLADRFGIRCVQGAAKNEFSLDPSVIHYGDNSGFQAVNLAILKGCKRIVLVGFDMRHVDGKAHFFGDHPKEARQCPESSLANFAKHFARAAAVMPRDISIVNATPGSALTCFPMMGLDDALGGLHWNRPEPDARAGAVGA